MSDAGQYTCKVTSVAGTAEKIYELDVYGEGLLKSSLVFCFLIVIKVCLLVGWFFRLKVLLQERNKQ